MDDFSLENILRDCTNSSSPSFDQAWTTLIARYKNYIYKVIYNCCSNWHPNLGAADLSDMVNDILNDVFILIYQHEGRALAQFKAVDSELAFRGYLATISNRVAKRVLQKNKVFAVFDDTFHPPKGRVSQDTKWLAFDYLVTTLRHKAGKQERRVERNILLFNLYNFEDFTKDMLQLPPIFHGMGHRVVDNVIGRYRAKLDKEDENNLREILID